MMSFEKYVSMYRHAYECRENQLAVMDAPYTEEQLMKAYDAYTDRAYDFWACFKPSSMAQSNVAFYDYQVVRAFAFAGIERTPEEMKRACREEHDRVLKICRDWQAHMKQIRP